MPKTIFSVVIEFMKNILQPGVARGKGNNWAVILLLLLLSCFPFNKSYYGKLHQFKNSAFLAMTVDKRAQEIWFSQYYLYLRSNLNF